MSYDPATYVEGIPVKISEKYRPPRKVGLSSLCNYHVNTEVLTAEYDLTTELETLKWLQNLKNYKDNRVDIRKEKIRKYEEEQEEKKRIKEKELEEERKRKEEEETERKRKEEEEEAEKKLEEEQKLEEERILQAERKLKQEEEHLDEEETRETVDNEQENKDAKTDIHNLENENENKYDHNIEDNGSYKTEADESISINEVSGGDSTVIYKHNRPVPIDDSRTYNSSQVIPIPSHLNINQSPYSPMLVPTQFQASHQKSPTKPGYNINFADFEGDSNDPFDSATLKSINDMEELAKVLQASNMKQQKAYTPNTPMNFGYPQPGTYMNGGYSYNPYSYMNYTPTNLPLSSSPLYNQMPSYHSKISSSPNTSVPLAGKPGVFPQDDFTPKNYSQWNSLTNNSNNQPANASQFKSYNYVTPQNIMPNINNSNLGLPMDNSFKNMGTTYPNPSSKLVSASALTGRNVQVASSGVESVNKRQDLEDFYTRYYSNKKSASGARSGENTPSSQQNIKGTLSSSSSVPDLTVSEDNEVSNIIANNQFEKIGITGSSSCTPTRPLSTSGYEINRTGQRAMSKSPSIKCRLPDPFSELNEEAQTLVQSIAEMGFPRPRVARAVQKLGTDHKKLLEVLLTLQSFQENGEDEYLSERAFYFFMGEVSKVNDFLLASKTLLDLGFEEEPVIERLFKYNNDKEKCLEELISMNT